VGDEFPAGAANRKESGMSYVVTQVVDPVCGMTINRENAVAVTYQGTTSYFCEDVCAQIFRDEPDRWVEKFEHDPMPLAH
jgi:YHS domain-containing protein